jgi:hypothetical protein
MGDLQDAMSEYCEKEPEPAGDAGDIKQISPIRLTYYGAFVAESGRNGVV